MAQSKYLTAPLKTDKMPPGVPYIVGNEAAERFSYYGMNSILVIFMTTYMMNRLGLSDRISDTRADAWYHTFVSSLYFLSILGAFLADAVLGKYLVIFSLSIVYCFGHLTLAINDTRIGLAIGLGLIALGAGGIKPCVSSNVGDQFGATNQHLLSRVFSWFYFAINFGSAFSTILIPWMLEPPSFSTFSSAQIKDPPALISNLQRGSDPFARQVWGHFSAKGREELADPKTPVERQGKVLVEELNKALAFVPLFETNSFAGVALTAKTKDLLAEEPRGQMRILLNRLLLADIYPRELEQSPAATMSDKQIRLEAKFHGPHIAFGTPGIFMFIATVVFWLGRKKFVHLPPTGVRNYFKELATPENFKALGNLLILVPFAAMFWALWNQNFSSWVLQSEKMDRHLFGVNWLPAQIQTVNPIFILVMLPLFSYLIYPAINKVYRLTPLRKFGMGLFVTALSFLIIAWIQMRIDVGQTPNIIWQVVAFVVLTAAEVMVSVTHLEFAYTQAPKKMKSLVMCTYLVSVALGNGFTAIVNFFIQNKDGTVKLQGASYFLFFVIVMAVTAVLFLFFAGFYKGKTYIQDETESQPA